MSTNPFKNIEDKDVPERLKKSVMNDVKLSAFMMEAAALFSLHYLNSVGSLFKTNTKTPKPKNSRNE